MSAHPARRVYAACCGAVLSDDSGKVVCGAQQGRAGRWYHAGYECERLAAAIRDAGPLSWHYGPGAAAMHASAEQRAEVAAYLWERAGRVGDVVMLES